jgi:predicted nucleic acid-binding protein
VRLGRNVWRSWTLSLAVVDSSAVIEVVGNLERSEGLRELFDSNELIAPDLVNAEVLHALRNLERRGEISTEDADQAVRDFASLPMDRVPTEPSLPLIWSYRANVTAYDACYVALARQWRCPLITLDAKLTRVPKLGVRILTA